VGAAIDVGVVSRLRLVLHGEIEFEFRRKLVFGVKTIGEIHAANPTVGVDLDSERFDVVGAVGSPREIGEIELNLIPAVVESHGHGANEGLHSRRRLIIARPKSTPHVLVIQHLNFESEVFLQVLDDHDEERQLDSERLFWIRRTRDVGRADVGSNNLKDEGLDVVICDTFYVTIAHLFIPYLQRFTADAVENG